MHMQLLSLCFFIFYCALFRSPALAAGPISTSSIRANFTASYLQFIDNAGAFLASANGSFQARITNSKPESKSFYFLILHVSSNTIVWSANRNHPISQSSQLRLTADGLSLYNDASQPIWSTPSNPSSVSSMQLLDSGNLLLLDASKNIVWQSFDFPTDSLVAGQKLPVGKSLTAAASGDGELSEGSYRLLIGGNDAVLQWNGMVYWKLSMDDNAFIDTNSPVGFLTVNATGVFLMAGNVEGVVIKRIFNPNSGNSSDFVYAKLDHNGLLNVVRFNSVDRSSMQEFEGPVDRCQIPMICRKLGVCSNGGSCSCVPGFHSDPKIDSGDCVLTDSSLLLEGSCSNASSSSEDKDFKYFSLRKDLDYFSNNFTDPVIRDVDVSFCQRLCSQNCSCMGVFYAQSSGSCYMIRNYLGSMNLGSGIRVGYVKMLVVGTPNSDDADEKFEFPIIAVIVLSLTGVEVIIAIVAVICLRRRRRRRRFSKQVAKSTSDYKDEERDLVSIPGPPVRLDYKEVAEATQGFSTQIGSGGFGTVFKGTLRDGSEVAVKKIRSLGAEGKREFLSEIAAIGEIRHANLVKLKGFCVHEGERFLIYDYMNRGSLDRTLFHGEAVLEWKDRCKIAIGAARGLEYLHGGCESKIIHCDVKPENILLNDRLQVKVSDFGLSKLLSREQSGFFTTMRGTRGYVAPEWLTNTPISDKTDVYSYGMVLLEIISGVHNFSLQRRINSQNEHEQCVVNFPLRALEMHVEKQYIELVDPRLEGECPEQGSGEARPCGSVLSAPRPQLKAFNV